MEKRPWDIGEFEDGQVVDQFGQVLNPFQPMIGPIPVPWTIWRWRFNARTGKFKTIAQNYVLNPKTREILSKGYRDKSVQGRMHTSGSPVFEQAQVEAVFVLAEKERISLAEAMPAWADSAKIGLNPDFLVEVAKGPKLYPFEGAVTPPPVDPRDAEIARLKAELADVQAKTQGAPAVRRRPVPAV